MESKTFQTSGKNTESEKQSSSSTGGYLYELEQKVIVERPTDTFIVTKIEDRSSKKYPGGIRINRYLLTKGNSYFWVEEDEIITVERFASIVENLNGTTR